MPNLDLKSLPPKTQEAARQFIIRHFDEPVEDIDFMVPLINWIFYLKYYDLMTEEIELELMPLVYGTK